MKWGEITINNSIISLINPINFTDYWLIIWFPCCFTEIPMGSSASRDLDSHLLRRFAGPLSVSDQLPLHRCAVGRQLGRSRVSAEHGGYWWFHGRKLFCSNKCYVRVGLVDVLSQITEGIPTECLQSIQNVFFDRKTRYSQFVWLRVQRFVPYIKRGIQITIADVYMCLYFFCKCSDHSFQCLNHTTQLSCAHPYQAHCMSWRLVGLTGPRDSNGDGGPVVPVFFWCLQNSRFV